MKKALALIIISLVFFTSCRNNSAVTSSQNLNDEIYENPETNETVDDRIYVNLEINETYDNFVCRRNFCEVNNYIYYYTSDGKSLRRCKPDLTDDILLTQDVADFYIQNSTVYFAKSAKNNGRIIYKADLDTNDFNAEIITELKCVHDPIIFRGKVFYKFLNQVRAYNIDEDTEEIIIEESLDKFNIVDHYIYYNLPNDNRIYRYDIDSEITEEFFSFEMNEKFTPKISYSGRTIVIQTYMNSFVYVNIDDLLVKNIVFDTSEYEQGWASFSCADNENLYFCVAESHNVANPLTTPHSIFKVELGKEETELIKIVIGENKQFIANNSLYYFDDNEKICKEELDAY